MKNIEQLRGHHPSLPKEMKLQVRTAPTTPTTPTTAHSSVVAL